MRSHGNAGSLRTALPFLFQTMVVGYLRGGQCPVVHANGGIVIADRDAGFSRYRKEKRRNLLMEAPCSLKVPRKSAAKGSDCICCIIGRPPFLVVCRSAVRSRPVNEATKRRGDSAANKTRAVGGCSKLVEK